KWWDYSQRVCAQPVLISDITGRTIQDKQAEAEAQAAIGRQPAPTAMLMRPTPAWASPALRCRPVPT
ncbi:MAG: hypothetical protein ACK53I_12035, partial [Phenylobacterium sp.]